MRDVAARNCDVAEGNWARHGHKQWSGGRVVPETTVLGLVKLDTLTGLCRIQCNAFLIWKYGRI